MPFKRRKRKLCAYEGAGKISGSYRPPNSADKPFAPIAGVWRDFGNRQPDTRAHKSYQETCSAFPAYPILASVTQNANANSSGFIPVISNGVHSSRLRNSVLSFANCLVEIFVNSTASFGNISPCRCHISSDNQSLLSCPAAEDRTQELPCSSANLLPSSYRRDS